MKKKNRFYASVKIKYITEVYKLLDAPPPPPPRDAGT